MVVRKLSAVVAVMIAVLGSLTLAAPAQAANAFEFNHAVSTTKDGCFIYQTPVGCGDFDSRGDYFLVKDTLPDGHSAAIYWHNYLPGSTALYRWGSCVNSLGNGQKGQCNKNFQEGSKIEYKVCAFEGGSTPSDVRSYFECGDVWETTA